MHTKFEVRIDLRQGSAFCAQTADRQTDRQTDKSKTSYPAVFTPFAWQKQDNVYGAVILHKEHCQRVYAVHALNVERAPGGRRPLDQTNRP